jgi:MoaA/NifB/PqqE/SkfB family radical SAM enzyme
MSDTFCVLAWKQLTVWPDGAASVCCPYQGRLTTETGRQQTVYEDSLDAIWNSEEMRGIRRDMLAGKPVTACATCYEQESHGLISIRQSSNEDWKQGWLNPQGETRGGLAAASEAQGHRVTAPRFLQLNVGNQCNLKCRMCDGTSSSRIALDPVHRKWNDAGFRLPLYRDNWWQGEAWVREILRHPGELLQLTIVGGEPLIIKELKEILEHLVNAGAAPNITLSVTTNGTTTHSPWLDLAQRFRHFHVYLSIDGFGPTYEYIRYPARWATLVKNLGEFQRLPRTALGTSVTLQAYNVLDIVDLFRFLDGVGMPFCVFNLENPSYLATRVLPPAARRLAAQRLRTYAETHCRPVHRSLVESLAFGLESLGDEWDPQLVRRFMLFTNDLDGSRNQSFGTNFPELRDLFADAGVEWTGETLHHAPAT